MPETSVSRDFLHRCCVQFSSPLEDDAAIAAETKHALRFARAHAATHASEVARALVWRVVDTDDDNDRDRAGAWAVLSGVLAECGEAESALSHTPLADKLSLFLPFLIPHRWFTTMARRDGHGRYSTGPSQGSTTGGRLQLNAFEKVIPSSTINDSDRKALDAQTVFVLRQAYRRVVEIWENVWRADVFKEYKQLMRSVDRNGNTLSAEGARHLSIPATFRDSLWRLRRKSPRPSLALHVLHVYGWSPIPEAPTDNNAVRPRGRRLPATMAEVEALDPAMHPGVRKWLQQLLEAKGGCRLCDSWLHQESRCPCEMTFVRPVTITAEETEEEEGRSGPGHKGPQRRGQRWQGAHQLPTAGGRRYTYMEAVDRLYRSDITLPLRAEDVLDHVVNLIIQERPYDEVLAAFDTVRGAVTGPEELHALWIHASYSLLPSRTVFDKPNDDGLSPALEKAEYFLKSRRRLREWDQLLRCVEVLDTSFRRQQLPERAEHFIEEIRETSSFFFCLVDGSLPVSYTPGKYARVPEEVVGVARLKDILCHSCLRPFHTIENCPHKEHGGDEAEPWDLQVARLVLDEYDLLDLRSSADNVYRIDDAMRRIDEDSRKAKDFRKMELRLAIKLLVDRRVPYCESCRIAGHSTKRCEARARRIFAREGLREVDVKLDPKTLFSRLRQLRRDEKEAEASELRDAFGVLAAATRGYPSSYMAAIRELDDAHVPLAAARYSTDAVQGFLLYINSGDLLAHLRPLRAADFPEVCLFCDSYHHRCEDCHDAKPGEQGFLKELRRCGVGLWQYLRSPKYYDSRLPTDHLHGRASIIQLVRQFDSEYGPGGIARQKFVEHNGLEGVAGLSQMAGATSQPTLQASASYYGELPGATQSSLGATVAPLYGRSFSQLHEPAQEAAVHVAVTEDAAGLLGDSLAGATSGGYGDLYGLTADVPYGNDGGVGSGVLGDSGRVGAEATAGLKRGREELAEQVPVLGAVLGDGAEDAEAREAKAARTEGGLHSQESSGGPAASSADGVLA